MIKFAILNSLKFTSDIPAAGFIDPETALYEYQRRGAVQFHEGRPVSKMVLAANSQVRVQFQRPGIVTGVSTRLAGQEEWVTQAHSEVADGYWTVEIDMTTMQPFVFGCTRMEMRVASYNGSGLDYHFFTSETFQILTFAQQEAFYRESRSFGIAYRSELGLYNGYYWDGAEYQKIMMSDTIYEKSEPSITKEAAPSAIGEEHVLRSNNLEAYSYKFFGVPEYLYQKILRAAGMPEAHLNGQPISLDSVSVDLSYEGLKNFTIKVQQSKFADTHQEDRYTDYLPETLEIEVWGEPEGTQDVAAADDNNVVLVTEY